MVNSIQCANGALLEGFINAGICWMPLPGPILSTESANHHERSPSSLMGVHSILQPFDIPWSSGFPSIK